MRTPARRAVIGTAVGVVLALTAVTGVSAYWQAQQSVAIDTVSSGDLAVTASWLNGAPSWPALFPGHTTPDTTIHIETTTTGDTLVWRLRLAHIVAPDFEPHTTVQAWIGSCGTGTPIPAEGAGEFTSTTETVDVCIRFTLDPDAPNSLQGHNFSPAITVIAEQVSG